MESGRFGETIKVLADYGMQLVPSNYPLYKTICLEIFVECDPKEIIDLKQALYNFYTLLKGTGDINSPAGKEFNKYLHVCHF